MELLTQITDAGERDLLAQYFGNRVNDREIGPAECQRDLRSLKRTLQMDVLRCKTPELVRKEIWTHILAYNLVRTIIAQAAAKYDIQPRSISFKGQFSHSKPSSRCLRCAHNTIQRSVALSTKSCSRPSSGTEWPTVPTDANLASGNGGPSTTAFSANREQKDQTRDAVRL
jgi:hypothetical protein